MKKSFKWLALVSLLLIVVMSFALVSCGGGDDDTDTNTDTNSGAAASYTITFKQADGTEEKVTVKTGETVTVPAVKQVDGYSVAWETTDFSNVTADMTVNAVKTAIDYTITYEVDGGENNANNPAKYTIETATINLSNAKKTGYKFLGWYSDEELTTAVTEIVVGSKGNVTLYAKWELVTYTIEYDTKGGTNDIGNPTAYDITSADIVLKGAELDGYDFVGWYEDQACTKLVEKIAAGTTGNIKLYAKYEDEKFDIVYQLNGGSNNKDNPKKFNKNDAITFANPTKNGYDFVAWYSDSACTAGNEVTGIDKGTVGTVTVYAKWTPVVYNLTYEVYDKGEINPENPTSYTAESNNPLLPPLNIKPGYTFAGWYKDGAYSQQIENAGDGLIKITKLYAKYEAIVYDITYELNGAENSKDNPSTYTVENTGAEAIKLADPTYLGCVFLGWYYGEDKVTEVPAVVGGVTLTAKWEYETFDITYVLNQVGATNAPENKDTYGREKDFELVAPIKEGVVFLGWYLDAEFTLKIEKTDELIGDATFYAKWSPALNLTKDDMQITQENAHVNADLNVILLNGNTECAGLYDWSQSDWYFNQHASKGTEKLTITLNNPTTISGFRMFAKAPGVDFELKLLDADNNEITAITVNVGDHVNTQEAVFISAFDGITYSNVKTITITCKSLSKPFRVAEVIVEVPNSAYEAPAVEETPIA